MITTTRRLRRTTVLACASVLLTGFAEAAPTSAASTQVGDPIEVQPADCFGPYYPLMPNSAVIYAQPYPAITWGTAGDDIIIGTNLEDHIYGLGGNDRICSGDGPDYVEGGLLAGGSGYNDIDHIDGGTGSDVLHGGQMTDYIYGGTNFSPAGAYQTHDFLYGDDGDDSLFGEGGPDALDGGPGTDYCDGGTGMAGTRPEADVAVNCLPPVNVP